MIDKNSKTWRYIEAYLEEKIEEDRRQLESPNCPENTAFLLRGRIMAARDLLDLPNADSE